MTIENAQPVGELTTLETALSLLHGDVALWTPDQCATGHEILKVLIKKLDERIDELRAAMLEIVRDVETHETEGATVTVNLPSAKLQLQHRMRKTPVEAVIMKFARDNGYLDSLFPRVPVLDSAAFESLHEAGLVPEDVWEKAWKVSRSDVLVVKASEDVKSKLDALTHG